jgi:L-seryl-tRNA(Ser) seleniumtransferase
LVARLRRNPMFRALRLDKLIYQSLEGTLRNLLLERWDQIPALGMIRASSVELRARAENFAGRLGDIRVNLLEGNSLIGGGATPQQPLPAWLIAIECQNVAEAERRCRLNDPPVIARIEDGRLLVDLRTVLPGEEEELASALRQACSDQACSEMGEQHR